MITLSRKIVEAVVDKLEGSLNNLAIKIENKIQELKDKREKQ